jgi:hypothetical protein
MPHARFSPEEIGKRGRQWYAQTIRAQVETPENIGRIVCIDIETGDFEIADENLTAAERLQSRHPDAAIYGIRIGYNAVYALGGILTRTSPMIPPLIWTCIEPLSCGTGENAP